MAKSKKAEPKRKKARKKVWHIFNFGQRYELPDDVRYCRVTALKYTQDFVSADDDEANNFKEQYDLLRSYPDHLTIKGAFRELKTLAANRSRCYRGYLLDQKFQPATVKRISQLLGASEDVIKKCLAALEDVGLIERIPMPDFDEDVNSPPGGDGDKTGGNSAKTTKRTYRRRGSTAKTNVSGRHRKPFNKVEVEKNNEKKTKSESEKEDKNKKESKEQRQSQHQPGKDQTGAKPVLKARSGAEGASGSVEGNPEMRPIDSTDSTYSTKSDGSDSLAADVTADLSAPATKSDGEVRTSVAGNSLDGRPSSFEPPSFDRIYDPRCKQFAIEVFIAIGTPYATDSPEAAGNLGCFAQQWSKAQQAGIGNDRLCLLWRSAMVNAKKLLAKRKRRVHFKESPEAVWVWQFKRKLGKMIREQAAGAKEPKVGAG